MVQPPTDPAGRPGEKCPRSGIYQASVGDVAQVALSKGDRFPPIPGQGGRWRLVTPTEDRQDDGALD